MSRSRRKAPVRQLCSHTQKGWKREYNRCLRHRNKILTEKGRIEHAPIRGEEQTEDGPQHGWDAQIWADIHDVSDIWTSPSDGWIDYWDYFSERRKQSLWAWYLRLPPERAEKYRKEDEERDERLKWKLWTK